MGDITNRKVVFILNQFLRLGNVFDGSQGLCERCCRNITFSCILLGFVMGIAFTLKTKCVNVLCGRATGTITGLPVNGVPYDLIPVLLVDSLIFDEVGIFIDWHHVIGHTDTVQIADKCVQKFFVNTRAVIRRRIRIDIGPQLQRIILAPVLRLLAFFWILLNVILHAVEF